MTMQPKTQAAKAPETRAAPASRWSPAVLLQSSAGSVFIVSVVLCLALGATTRDFFSMVNFVALARSFSIVAIVGMAQMVIIGTGGMNLSVGAIGGLVGIITGGLMDALKLSPGIGVPVGLCVGMACGFVNGWLITRLGVSGVSSFLVTLASGSVFTGITVGISKANPFYNLPMEFKWVGTARLGGIPVLLFVMLGVAVLLHFVMAHLGIGRQILSLGGNIRAAELSGVPVNRVVILAHMISGLLAGFAAILLISRLGSAQPDVGRDWMLASFAAPIIGGTRLAGGTVTVTGAVLGAVLLALISSGLVFLNISIYWNQFIQGLIILTAVGVDRLRTVSSERVGRRPV
jgi:ribose transport system permease protein